MNKYKAKTPQFAICINNSEYPASLELHKVYRVLSDEEAAKEGDFRVIDESGEDYLYPADYFNRCTAECGTCVITSFLKARAIGVPAARVLH